MFRTWFRHLFSPQNNSVNSLWNNDSAFNRRRSFLFDCIQYSFDQFQHGRTILSQTQADDNFQVISQGCGQRTLGQQKSDAAFNFVARCPEQMLHIQHSILYDAGKCNIIARNKYIVQLFVLCDEQQVLVWEFVQQNFGVDAVYCVRFGEIKCTRTHLVFFSVQLTLYLDFKYNCFAWNCIVVSVFLYSIYIE